MNKIELSLTDALTIIFIVLPIIESTAAIIISLIALLRLTVMF